MARLLVDDAALLEHLGLAADLVGQPVVQVLEGVHVLQLGLGAEGLGAAAAQRHVAVAAQGTLSLIHICSAIHESWLRHAQERIEDKQV